MKTKTQDNSNKFCLLGTIGIFLILNLGILLFWVIGSAGAAYADWAFGYAILSIIDSILLIIFGVAWTVLLFIQKNHKMAIIALVVTLLPLIYLSLFFI
ncbi:MAG: hypothetical protein ABIG20_02865 [archaeon]